MSDWMSIKNKLAILDATIMAEDGIPRMLTMSRSSGSSMSGGGTLDRMFMLADVGAPAATSKKTQYVNEYSKKAPQENCCQWCCCYNNNNCGNFSGIALGACLSDCANCHV